MSFFKKVCPQNLSDRITHALCVGPLSGLQERVLNEIRDYTAQKVCTLYIKAEQKNLTAREVLNELCDAFGLSRPGEERDK